MVLSVVIVNYNVKYFLENTINSVLSASKNFDCEIIVVDNCSVDGSFEYISALFPQVKYIYNQDNVGFAKANNQGLKIATGEYILVLNPDTLLFPDTLSILINYLQKNPSTDMVGCRVNQADGRLDNGCRRSFPTPWNSFTHISGLSKIFNKSSLFTGYNLLSLPVDKIAEVDAISGCFMLFRRKILDLGIYLPEEYFMYGEDLDFCFQIRAAGMKIEYVPLASIIHYRGQSSRQERAKLRRHFYQSMNIFVQKNYSSKYTFAFKTLLDTGIFIAYITSLLKLIVRKLFLPIIDGFSFLLSILISYVVYSNLIDTLHLSVNLEALDATAMLWISPVYLSIFYLIFHQQKNYRDYKYSIKRFLSSTLLFSLMAVALTFFFKNFAYSRAVLFLMLVIAPVIMLIGRFILFRYTKLFLLRTLVVGLDKVSKEMVLNHLPSLTRDGLTICGFVESGDKQENYAIERYPVYGNIKNLKDVIKLEKIDQIIFSSNSLSFDKIAVIIEEISSLQISYKILPNPLLVKNGRLQFINIG